MNDDNTIRDLEIKQHNESTMNDTSNKQPKPVIKNEVLPMQPNIETMSKLINNPLDNAGIMSHSNEMDQLKNDPSAINETKQQISTPQGHYHDDLSILEKDSTSVDVTDSQYYNINGYVRPIPTAPTLEAIYGTSPPPTNTWYSD